GIGLGGGGIVAEEAGPPRRESRENRRVDRLLPRWPDAGRPSQHERSALGGSRDRAPLRPLARRWSSLLLQPRRQPARDLRGTRRGHPGLGPAADPPAAPGDGPRLGPAALPAARRSRQAAARPGAG